MNMWQKLREIFNQVDPAEIFYEPDEYDSEIGEFLAAKIDIFVVGTMETTLKKIFKYHFA